MNKRANFRRRRAARILGLSVNPIVIAWSEPSSRLYRFSSSVSTAEAKYPVSILYPREEKWCATRARSTRSPRTRERARRRALEIFIRLPRVREYIYFFYRHPKRRFAGAIILDGYHRILQRVGKKTVYSFASFLWRAYGSNFKNDKYCNAKWSSIHFSRKSLSIAAIISLFFWKYVRLYYVLIILWSLFYSLIHDRKWNVWYVSIRYKLFRNCLLSEKEIIFCNKKIDLK